MRLYEYVGKELFGRYGIPVPGGKVARSAADAIAIAADIGYPVVVKVQILSGGRQKAGGVKFCSSDAELEAAVNGLMGTTIRGLVVEQVLVESRLDIERELYLGLIVDAARRAPLLILSTRGGVDIEDVPDDQLARVPIDVCFGLSPYQVREALRPLGLTGKLAGDVAAIAERLYRLMVDCDAEMVEINPLVVAGGKVLAADARVTIDDFALYRQSGLGRTAEGTPLELELRQQGLAFVQLDGDIAVMANGAGVTMAIIDMLSHYGGRAANFLDAGGGAGVETTVRGIRAILRTDPRAVLISIFGGITRCDDVARAIVQVMTEQQVSIPVVVRLTGINRDEAAAILSQIGITPITELEEAVERAVAAARGGA